jgi:hypothetical protein
MAEDDIQFRRRSGRTRWIAALLEGSAAAALVGLLSGHGQWAGIAFGTVAAVAFLLWPMTIKDREFPLWRLAVFAALVFSLGACLSFFFFLIPLYSAQTSLNPIMLILEWTALAVWALGIFAIPVATAIARLAIILGNPRLDPK